MDYLTTHKSLSPIRRGFAPGFLNYKKGVLDSQSQGIKITSCLPMVDGSLPETPASSITKTGCHDIAEILLKVALSTINQIKSSKPKFIILFANSKHKFQLQVKANIAMNLI